MNGVTEEMVTKALARRYAYNLWHARRRRAQSRRVFGHPGAAIYTGYSDRAAMRHALEAAVNDS